MTPNLPIVVVDFEASCLGEFSYPIEAGLARWDGPGHPIRTWSSLIRPMESWIRHGDWLWEAQQIHGIDPAELVNGLAPREVVKGLKALAGDSERVLCDGGSDDLRWLTRLTMASGWKGLPFGLGDYDEHLMTFEPDAYEAAVMNLERTFVPHRAGPDAVRMVQACVIALTAEPARIEIVPEPG